MEKLFVAVMGFASGVLVAALLFVLAAVGLGGIVVLLDPPTGNEWQ